MSSVQQQQQQQQSATPATAPVTPISCRILRSPSRESVTTDLSLFSISSTASEAVSRANSASSSSVAAANHHKSNRSISFKEHRGLSPKPDLKSVHLNKLVFCISIFFVSFFI